MLIKRNNFMPIRAHNVKKLTRQVLSLLALCTAAIAPAAFAGGFPVVDKTVNATFKLSELQAEDGSHKVYAKLKKRALSYCRTNSSVLRYYAQSKRECIDDLMTQFVESADIDVLNAYHLSQKSVATSKKFVLK